jgi:hypothetical protein
MKAFIFECSSTTYLDCVEKNLFGSNKPWPLQIKAGDYCLLHHYEIGGLLGLWQATSDGSKNIVPRIWGGKFPLGRARLLPSRSPLSVFTCRCSPTTVARAFLPGRLLPTQNRDARRSLHGLQPVSSTAFKPPHRRTVSVS